MGGRSRSASAGAPKKVRQPDWTKYRGAWWWKDPKTEGDDWHPQEDFNQKEWNKAQAGPALTGAEKAVNIAKRTAQGEMQLARNSAMSAAKAWGHNDSNAQKLLAKLDALYDKKRADLDSPALVEALAKELDAMESKIEDLTIESSKISERLLRIGEEQKYLTERAGVLQAQKDSAEKQLAEEDAGGPSPQPTGAAGGIPRNAGSVSSASQPASSAGAPALRIQAIEQQMANMNSQIAAVLGALSLAHGVPAAAPVGGGAWDSHQNWSQEQNWEDQDWSSNVPGWNRDIGDDAAAVETFEDMDQSGGS